MSDQGVKNSREDILQQIAYQRQELEKYLDKAIVIEAEINALEAKFYSQGESLDNPMACYNPIIFAQKKCEECRQYRRCVYRGKADYGRFKL
ncbi:hypothetical protein [Desulfosporosinus youngiae]|uniref:Uncharacterized protein n=1 Tax=Desulfosporosinus youngiae DSM 17734 TaxID=768710 RepID=H5Y264_9FIRM|nr:hypothetical protein [Desulfosporosinus youngiae]EHQ88262.1 hypothetical protein DesyoDRAFT_1092 [Desulfosporosinus youngiae DSM 17734]